MPLRRVLAITIFTALFVVASSPLIRAQTTDPDGPEFEIGPWSEASIGNVGMDPKTTGSVDHVVTPAGAFAVPVAEDALDKYFLEWFERRVGNRFARASLRIVFTPARALANIAEMRAPWDRVDRALRR